MLHVDVMRSQNTVIKCVQGHTIVGKLENNAREQLQRIELVSGGRDDHLANSRRILHL